MRYSILEYAAVSADKSSIIRFIKHRSAKGASAWLKAYEKHLGILEQLPLSFPPAAEKAYSKFDLRESYFKTRSGRRYRVVYVVLGNTVHIYRVRGPNQDLLRAEDFEFE